MPIRDLEKRRASKREYERLHPEESRERGRQWREKNKERSRALARERARRYRERNPEKVREASRNCSQRHPEVAKTWRKNNIEKVRNHVRSRRARISQIDGSFTPEEWIALKNKFGNRCLCCGTEETKLDASRKIVPDHVIPVALGGTNDIGNIQPLCHGLGGCNNKKSNKNIDYR